MNDKIDRSDLNFNQYARNNSIKIDNISTLDENMRNLSTKYNELRNIVIDALKSFYKIQNEYTDETNFLVSQEISKIIDSEIQKIVDKIDLQQEDNIDEVLTTITNSINVNYVNSPEIISNNINETDFSKIKNEILSELKNKILSLKNTSNNNNNNTDQDSSVKNLKAEFGNKIKTKIFDPIINVISQNIIENIERLKKIDNLEKHINFKNFFTIIGNEIRDNYTNVTNFFKEKFESINENILKFTLFISDKITYFSTEISGFFTDAKKFIQKKIGDIISGVTSAFNFVVTGIKKVFSFLVTNIIGTLFKVIGFIVKVVFNVVKTALKIIGKLLLGAAALIYIGVGTLFSKEFWETRLGQTLKIALLTNKSFLFWTTVFITMVFKGIFKLVGFVFNLTKEVIDFFKQPSENNKLLIKIKEFLSKTYDAIFAFLDNSYIILNQMCWMFGINQFSKYMLSSKSGITRMFLNPKTRLTIFGIAMGGEFARREISGQNNEIAENEQEIVEYEQYAKETIADISSYFEGNEPLVEIDTADQETLNNYDKIIPSEFNSKDYDFDELKKYTLDEDIKNQVNNLSIETEKTISEIKLHNDGIPSDLSLDLEISKAINDANGISENDITGSSKIEIPGEKELNELSTSIDKDTDFNDDNLKNINEPFKTKLTTNISSKAAELNSDLSGLNSEIEYVEETEDKPVDDSINAPLNNYVVNQSNVKSSETPHSASDGYTSSLDTSQNVNPTISNNQDGKDVPEQPTVIPSETPPAPIASSTPKENQKESEQKTENEDNVSDNNDKQKPLTSEKDIIVDNYKTKGVNDTSKNLTEPSVLETSTKTNLTLPQISKETTSGELGQTPDTAVTQTFDMQKPTVLPKPEEKPLQELPQEIKAESTDVNASNITEETQQLQKLQQKPEFTVAQTNFSQKFNFDTVLPTNLTSSYSDEFYNQAAEYLKEFFNGNKPTVNDNKYDELRKFYTDDMVNAIIAKLTSLPEYIYLNKTKSENDESMTIFENNIFVADSSRNGFSLPRFDKDIFRLEEAKVNDVG